MGTLRAFYEISPQTLNFEMHHCLCLQLYNHVIVHHRCPTCREDFGERPVIESFLRNRALENVIENMNKMTLSSSVTLLHYYIYSIEVYWNSVPTGICYLAPVSVPSDTGYIRAFNNALKFKHSCVFKTNLSHFSIT